MATGGKLSASGGKRDKHLSNLYLSILAAKIWYHWKIGGFFESTKNDRLLKKAGKSTQISFTGAAANNRLKQVEVSPLFSCNVCIWENRMDKFQQFQAQVPVTKSTSRVDRVLQSLTLGSEKCLHQCLELMRFQDDDAAVVGKGGKAIITIDQDMTGLVSAIVQPKGLRENIGWLQEADDLRLCLKPVAGGTIAEQASCSRTEVDQIFGQSVGPNFQISGRRQAGCHSCHARVCSRVSKCIS